MITKNTNDIRTDMMEELLNRIPELDLTEGTPERDIFIEAPISGSLIDVWNEVLYTEKLQAFVTYYADLDDTDLENAVSNFNVTRNPATYSYGYVTLYSNSAPTRNIYITDGTVCRTGGASPIEFVIDGDYIIYYEIADSYYNATADRWEITCSVKARNAGPSYRAGSGTVTSLASTITGIDGCTNENPITGGTDQESNLELVTRAINSFQGRGLGPTQGLVNYISNYATAVNVVTANDAEMIRDEGLGGAIDFYIIGEDLSTVTDSVNITSTGLLTETYTSYTEDSVTLTYQPVNQVLSVVKNTTILPASYYELVVDTGILKNSTRGSDKVQLTSTGILNVGYFEDGDVVEITYLYNDLLTQIEALLNSNQNHYENRDYLLRTMTAVTVDVYIKLKEVSGQDFDLVSNTAETEISSEINSVYTAGSLEKADIFGSVKAITTVDNIDLTTMSLTPTGGGSLTEQGDIIFEKNEYPVAGTITIVQWTN
jgi:hypothetical protein